MEHVNTPECCDPRDIAYAAGLFDGRGDIGVSVPLICYQHPLPDNVEALKAILPGGTVRFHYGDHYIEWEGAAAVDACDMLRRSLRRLRAKAEQFVTRHEALRS